MILLPRHLDWLRQHGGRNASDVEEDKYGVYVWMGNGYGGLMKVYLPD